MAGLLEQVKGEAAKIDRCMRQDQALFGPDIDELLSAVLEYGLFNGGKRIRPFLTVLAGRLCTVENERIYQLGIAFEYLHAATLFHDDIIDGSATRRGKLSVHKKFGVVSAILAGDFLHAHAMDIVGQMAGKDGLASFCRATKGMAEGEFMQLRNAQKHNLSELDYYNAIMGKTGLLIAAACEVGAMFGGGNGDQVKALKSYGENLGCAFQVTDDLLDYLGNPEKTGKAVGNDLAEGKMTLPLILAIDRAGTDDRNRLLTIISSEEIRRDGLLETVELIDRYDGFVTARQQAEDASRRAVDNLRIFTSPRMEKEKMVLESLASYVVMREK